MSPGEADVVTAVHAVNSLYAHEGGPSRTVVGLCDALGDCGVQAVLVAKRTDQQAPIIHARHPRTRVRLVSRASLLPFRESAYARAVEQELAAATRPVLHVHGIWLSSNHRAIAAAAKTGVPLVLSPRGMLEPWSLAHHGWRKRLALALYQRADLLKAAAFVATSKQEAIGIRRLGLGQPIALIPNGVDLPQRIAPQANGPRTVLFLSRLHPKKGLELLLSAWRQLAPANWRLVIAGSGEPGYESTLRDLAAQAKGLEISFIGEVADDRKAALFARADVLALPSYSENFGVVIAEALAHGVPVLTSTETPWAAVTAKRCGWVVRPDVGDLAAALGKVLALNRAELRDMGLRGRQLIEAQFGWAGIGAKTRRLYDWLLRRTAPPADLLLD